jgi:hypothetical protein
MPKKGYPDPHDVHFVFPETITDKPIQFVDDGAASNDCI